ncbi:MAG: hypothetical protein HOK52_15010 [Candidatus Marinimicrobia bacterium]|jgi:hypothetical protein|nr:hypothetical protein [Candidatus Neomarinimicrobiota bacterium]MBT3937800.1 hypothetical protein [Candidatus Neomarinimicrobiota bacterium]MBT3960615.1 hypothetical protein [Candidatus Neomarinimicrobiota bacterium]MBT4383919.1 hypothetical protein [Candidatus Neomarinimicrobiota bacterium]MBT4636029.1 hypothetical protein [Candidatus Neomarinimicrobiota bacterium]
MFNRQKYLYIFWLIILVSTISAQSTEYFYHKNPGNSTEGDAVELSIMLLKDQPVSQGSIFFRPIGELSYQEIHLRQDGLSWYGEIPKEQVLSPGIEYVIIMDMPYGAKLSAPLNNDPFDAPLTISVRKKITQKEFGQINKISKSKVISDVLVLSPEAGSFIRPEDVVIAVSTFNSPNIDSTKYTVLIDGKDFSDFAILEQNILSVTPNDLDIGLHTVQLNFITTYGIEIEPIIWSFTITKSMVNVVEQLLYKGNINSLASNNSASGSSINEAEINGKLSAELSWIKGRVNFRKTSRESEFLQPLNRTTTSLFITDYLKIEYGDVYPSISPYIIDGKRIRGQLIDIHLPFFRLQTISGKLNETVQYQDYTNGGYTLLGDATVTDSTNFTKYYMSRTGYTFPREVNVIKLSFSMFNKIKAGLHVMKAKDDKNKVSKSISDKIEFSVDSLGYGIEAGDYTFNSFNSAVLAQGDTIIFPDHNWSGNSPEDNLVFGFDFESAMDNRKLLFQMGWNMSFYNTDIWNDEMTLAEMDTTLDDSLDGFIGKIYNDDGSIGESSFSPIDTLTLPSPSNYKDIFTINTNMIPLSPIDIRAMEENIMAAYVNMPSSAFFFRLKGHYSFNNLLVEYRQVGPQYKSLGNPYLTTNIREFNLNNRISVLERKLSVVFGYQYKDNNISYTTVEPLRTTKYSMNFTLVPGPGAPSIVVNIQSSKKNNDIDSLTVDTAGDYLSDPREKTQALNTLLSVNLPASFGKNFNNISISLNSIKYSDLLLSERRPDYFFSKTNSTTLSANISSRFSIPLKTNLSFNQTNLEIPYRDSSDVIMIKEMQWRSVGIGGQYGIFENRLQIRCGADVLSSEGSEGNINLYGGTLGLNWSIINNLSLNFSSNIRLNHSQFLKTDGLDNNSDGNIDEFGESFSVNTSGAIFTLGYKF